MTILSAENLSLSLDGQRVVLQGIDLEVREGERIGIAGANGAGKTSLLWCLLGLQKAGGELRLLGEPVGRSDRSQVGVVFQNPEDQLFMPRLLDDLTLPLVNRGMPLEEADRRARSTLAALGMQDHRDRPAAQLSLGERKRAALACALVGAPRLLVLDEPTAELDGRSSRRLAEALLQHSGTLIVASHDLVFLRQTTSRLVLLGGGRIMADGPTDQLLDDRPLLERAGLV